LCYGLLAEIIVVSLGQQGITIEQRKTWKYGGEALYFRDPDGHLLEVATPGVWSIF
jgi:catechol 2,3-dioxygenase-like lactoylglutathione lyase family enzyme